MKINGLDLVYEADCGCTVTFLLMSDFRSSRLTPGRFCQDHTKRHQSEARDGLITRARIARDKFLETQQ